MDISGSGSHPHNSQNNTEMQMDSSGLERPNSIPAIETAITESIVSVEVTIQAEKSIEEFEIQNEGDYERAEENQLYIEDFSDSFAIYFASADCIKKKNADSVEREPSSTKKRRLDSGTDISYNSDNNEIDNTGGETMSDSTSKNNYLKELKWAPDGSCIITNSFDKTLRIFNLPSIIDNTEKGPLGMEDSVVNIHFGYPVSDFNWYPAMNSNNIDSCFFATSSVGQPLQLWDAYKGTLKASFRAYDQYDEVAGSYAVQFSSCGQWLYGGLNKKIAMFELNSPGRPVYTGDAKGTVSAVSVHHLQPKLLAVGSFSKQVSLYDVRAKAQRNKLAMEVEFVEQKGGITHLAFSHSGLQLFCGGRNDEEIICWDLKNPRSPLCRFYRNAKTNQRLQFDLSYLGGHLITPSDGEILIYDLASLEMKKHIDKSQTKGYVNSISAHPCLPIFASGSGKRHFELESILSDSEDDIDVVATSESSNFDNSLSTLHENSLVLWKFDTKPWLNE